MESKLVNSLDSLLPVVTCSGHKEALWVKESMDFLFYTLFSQREKWLYLTSGGPAALVGRQMFVQHKVQMFLTKVLK